MKRNGISLIAIVLGLSALALLTAVAASGRLSLDSDNDDSANVTTDVEGRDAIEYSETFDVPVEEAKRRLSLQSSIDGTVALLESVAPDRLVGVWLEHNPEFAIVALFTGDDSGLEAAYAIASQSGVPVEIRTGGEASEAELLAAQIAASDMLMPEARLAGTYSSPITGAVHIQLQPDSPWAQKPAELKAILIAEYGVPFEVEVLEEEASDD